MSSARIRIPDQILPHMARHRSRYEKAEGSHEKLRKQGRISHERIGPALGEIAEVSPSCREHWDMSLLRRRRYGDLQAERRGVDAHSDFDAVSRLVKIEFARFDVERMEDFKGMLERYLDGMIARQKEVSCTSRTSWSPF